MTSTVPSSIPRTLPPSDLPTDSEISAATLKKLIAKSEDHEWAIQQIVEHPLLLTGFTPVDRQGAEVWLGRIKAGVAANLY